MTSSAQAISSICLLLISITLVMSAWGKTINFNTFHQSLVEEFKAPTALILPAVILLIALEWLLAALLLIPSSLNIFAIQATTGLFIAFTLLIGWALFKGKLISCNCFGKSNQPISKYDLVRNILLVTASLMALHLESGNLVLDNAEKGLLICNTIMIFVLLNKLEYIAWILNFRDPNRSQEFS